MLLMSPSMPSGAVLDAGDWHADEAPAAAPRTPARHALERLHTRPGRLAAAGLR
jgi:hypothetical protein